MHIHKLNNKGFAITGILYTLFVMFLLLMLSVLSGLSSKKNLLEKVTNDYEDTYLGTPIEEPNKITAIIESGEAIVTGKYIFEFETPLVESGTEEKTKVQCSTYLKKGTSLTDSEIIYTPEDCNNYDVERNLIKVYSFEKE